MSERLIKAMGVTLEITGTQLSDGAVKVMLADLKPYPEALALAALRRCCRELKGRLTLSDILSRIEDGRPGPEEAWAMVPKDEASSVYWTGEIRAAFSTAYGLLNENEIVQARMAFLERYKVLVQKARDEKLPIEWEFSPGTDPAGRETVLLEAVEKGRLSAEGAQRMLPHHGPGDAGLGAKLLALAEEKSLMKRIEATT